MDTSDRLPDAGRGDSDRAAGGSVTFETWRHDSLVQFAFEAHKRIVELEADRKLLLEAYRELLRRAQ